MQEIGGYIELDTYKLPMLHSDGIKLNCGRNALAYLIETRKITKLLVPKFMCDSSDLVYKNYNIKVRRYNIDINFKPIDLDLKDDEWLYLVNFYGQLSNDYIKELKSKYERVILDNAQAYFQEPIPGIDTIYTCRKFFGVADGAILYSDLLIERELEIDESFKRMNFLLGRFERTASEFYSEYAENNDIFFNEPIKRMSKLTENLLHGIDYSYVKEKRTENFQYLHAALKNVNKLTLTIPEGAFMYPLLIDNGADIRKKLQAQKIYIPTLWPSVYDVCEENELEYNMAKNILPLPVDQRYGREEMNMIIENILLIIKN